MIVAISGAVGVGKTTISKILSKKLNFECLHLNDFTEQFENSKREFDCDKLCSHLEEKIIEGKKNYVIESHFSQFLSPEIVDYIFIIHRSIGKLREEYEKRGYNNNKISENIEVECFNVCFFDAIENGFKQSQIFEIENCGDISKCIEKIISKLQKGQLPQDSSMPSSSSSI